MDWKGRRQSDNIEDRRGSSSRGRNPFGRGGIRLPSRRHPPLGPELQDHPDHRRGLSGAQASWASIRCRCLAADPGTVLTGQPSGPGSQISETRKDEMTQFVATVLAETEDVWNGIMKSQGFDYPEPTLVLFSGAVASACGNASSASGPFYCPGDQKVYIDLTFFDELAQRFKASGDFAQAYVLAHEVGHHVQNLIGVLPEFNRMRRSMSQSEQNQMSIRVELQADCFAGIWGHYTAQKGLLERGDLEEALNAAEQIGDDTLQRRTQGYVVPESFNHGTSAQRQKWFARGFETGRLDACDTFNNPV
jgi:predicted metalloprotease